MGNIGAISFHQGKYLEAEKWYLQTLDVAKENEDLQAEAISLHNLAELYRIMERFDDSVSHARKANHIIEANKLSLPAVQTSLKEQIKKAQKQDSTK